MSVKKLLKTAALLMLVSTMGQSEDLQGVIPLSGNYTVGSTGDFLSLEAAIAYIEIHGIAASVTLKILPGIYQTHVTIDSFNRTGFQGDRLTITAANQLDPPTLQHGAQTEADNWLIQLNQVSHIKISHLILEATGNMDLNNIITLENDSNHIEITDNEFNSYSITSSTSVQQGAAINNVTGSVLSDISILNNEFNGGNSAVRLKGLFDTKIKTLKINHNVCNEQTAIGSFNVINIASSEDLTVNFNTINNHIFNSKGMNIFDINRGEINGNTIAMLGDGAGGNAISIGNTNDAVTDVITIKNNFMVASRNALIIRSSQTSRVDVMHNTLVIDSDFTFTVPSNVLLVESGTDNIKIQNNILINPEDSEFSYVMTLKDMASVNISDGNLFFGLTDHPFEINALTYSNLSTYQTATSLDANSVAKSVDFVDIDNADFHLTESQYDDSDLLTLPLAEVYFDIDGDVRYRAMTLMGADEAPFIDMIFMDSFESVNN